MTSGLTEPADADAVRLLLWASLREAMMVMGRCSSLALALTASALNMMPGVVAGQGSTSSCSFDALWTYEIFFLYEPNEWQDLGSPIASRFCESFEGFVGGGFIASPIAKSLKNNSNASGPIFGSVCLASVAPPLVHCPGGPKSGPPGAGPRRSILNRKIDVWPNRKIEVTRTWVGTWVPTWVATWIAT